MRSEAHAEKIREIVRAVLERDLDDVRIERILVRDDVGRDGDDMLRIDVVFDGDRKSVDARKLSGLVRHVLQGLQAIDERAFPLFFFISSKEAKGLRFEAA